jgi:hypothetical protein
MRVSELCGSLYYFIYLKICNGLFYKTGLLACSMSARAMRYMPMHKAELIAVLIFFI